MSEQKKHKYRKTDKKVVYNSSTSLYSSTDLFSTTSLISNTVITPVLSSTDIDNNDKVIIPTAPQIPDLPKPNYDFPIDDFVLKAIRRITDMALYLQNYTFVFIYIPGFFSLLSDWKKIDLKSKETKEIVTTKTIISGTTIETISITTIGKYYSEESASYGNCMIDAYLHSASNNFDFKSTPKLRNDWDEFSSAPIAVSENDFILFTPYTLISTNLNFSDMDLTQFDLNQAIYKVPNRVIYSGELSLVFYEFMHPVITKYMSYYYSFINTVLKNSYIDFRGRPYLQTIPYAYITILTVTPDLKIPVSGITFLNSILTNDPMQQLMSIHVAAQEIKQVELRFHYQSYRRFFLRDDKYKLYFEGDYDSAVANELLYKALFIPIATVAKEEFLEKLKGYINKNTTNNNVNNNTV